MQQEGWSSWQEEDDEEEGRLLYRAGTAMRVFSPGPKRIDFDEEGFPDATGNASLFPFLSLG